MIQDPAGWTHSPIAESCKNMSWDVRWISMQSSSLEPFVLPFWTTAPSSPLVDLFIRSIAMLRSLSVKKVVDSGRSGRRNTVAIPNITGGIPYKVLITALVEAVGLTSMINNNLQVCTEEWMCWTPKAISPPKAPATAAKPNHQAIWIKSGS